MCKHESRDTINLRSSWKMGEELLLDAPHPPPALLDALRKSGTWKGNDCNKHPLCALSIKGNKENGLAWLRQNGNRNNSLASDETRLLIMVALVFPNNGKMKKKEILCKAFAISERKHHTLSSDYFGKDGLIVAMMQSLVVDKSESCGPHNLAKKTTQLREDNAPARQNRWALSPRKTDGASANNHCHAKRTWRERLTPKLTRRRGKRNNLSPFSSPSFESPSARGLLPPKQRPRAENAVKFTGAVSSQSHAQEATETETMADFERSADNKKISNMTERSDGQCNNRINSVARLFMDVDSGDLHGSDDDEEEWNEDDEDEDSGDENIEEIDLGQEMESSSRGILLTPGLSGLEDKISSTIAQTAAHRILTSLANAQTNVVKLQYTDKGGNKRVATVFLAPLPRKGRKQTNPRNRKKKASDRAKKLYEFAHTLCNDETELDDLVKMYVKTTTNYTLIPKSHERFTAAECIAIRE